MKTKIMVVVALAVAITLIGCETEGLTDQYLYRYHKIVAMKDESGLSGSFFLGSGSIEGKLYTYFAWEDELNGKVRIGRVPIESICIIFEDISPPMVKISGRVYGQIKSCNGYDHPHIEYYRVIIKCRESDYKNSIKLPLSDTPIEGGNVQGEKQ